MTEAAIIEFFQQYAHAPWLVYGAVCLFMLLSSFGLPIPEEVTLLSAGFIGHAALNPDPNLIIADASSVVNVYVLAAVAFFAVLGSDFLIYMIGKNLGPRVFKLRWMSRFVTPAGLEKVQRWMTKYGYWAVLIFRFTPGVRFPGHLMCGAMGFSPWKFLAVDTIAAGISVPTQVLLVSFYGDVILASLKQFKIYVFSALAVGFVLFLVYRFVQSKRAIRVSEPNRS